MKAVLFLISLLVVAVVGVYGAGSALPEEHTLIRGAHIAGAAEDVWQAIADYDALPEWNADITRAKRLEDVAGKPHWRLESADDRYMVLEVEAEEKPLRHISRIVESSYPVSGRWIFELGEQKNGTWVKLTEVGKTPSPFVRFLMYYIVGQDTAMVRFLKSLGKKFGQPVKVEELVA